MGADTALADLSIRHDRPTLNATHTHTHTMLEPTVARNDRTDFGMLCGLPAQALQTIARYLTRAASKTKPKAKSALAARTRAQVSAAKLRTHLFLAV